jgi:hypothetical protein
MTTLQQLRKWGGIAVEALFGPAAVDALTENQRRAARDYMDSIAKEAVARARTGIATAVLLHEEPDTSDIPEQGEAAFKAAKLTRPGDLLARQQAVKADPDANRDTTKLAGRFDPASNRLYSLVPCSRCRDRGETGHPFLGKNDWRWYVRCAACGAETARHTERRGAQEEWERMNRPGRLTAAVLDGDECCIKLARGDRFLDYIRVPAAVRQEVIDLINRKD